MKRLHRLSSDQKAGADRQILGELSLPADSDGEHAIHSWLLEILQPLHLSPDFLSRLSNSARESVTRAATLDPIAPDAGHIHLLVFGPRNFGVDQKTWGFFRIDKLDNTAGRKNLPGHSIEFYLYVEGE